MAPKLLNVCIIIMLFCYRNLAGRLQQQQQNVFSDNDLRLNSILSSDVNSKLKDNLKLHSSK